MRRALLSHLLGAIALFYWTGGCPSSLGGPLRKQALQFLLPDSPGVGRTLMYTFCRFLYMTHPSCIDKADVYT